MSNLRTGVQNFCDSLAEKGRGLDGGVDEEGGPSLISLHSWLPLLATGFLLHLQSGGHEVQLFNAIFDSRRLCLWTESAFQTDLGQSLLFKHCSFKHALQKGKDIGQSLCQGGGGGEESAVEAGGPPGWLRGRGGWPVHLTSLPQRHRISFFCRF